uniref:Uncharacterized protein n=1 Tax=Rhizophora mucronata TaxID=61149 RepID=A0A2P2N1N2_RHIMU
MKRSGLSGEIALLVRNLVIVFSHAFFTSCSIIQRQH